MDCQLPAGNSLNSVCSKKNTTSKSIHNNNTFVIFNFDLLQLEPYMDETFIENAFAQMGETTTGVKLIKNKHTR